MTKPNSSNNNGHNGAVASTTTTTTTTAMNTRNLSCEICELVPSIYACPKCEIRTCSLSCVRAHKQSTGCTGKRDRSTFLTKGNMTDSTLRSDYFFLEEVLNQLPDKKRKYNNNNNNDYAMNNDHHSKYSKNKQRKISRFVQQAQHRDIKVQIMPEFMERHKSNTSWYNPKQDLITWKIDIIIVVDKNPTMKLSCLLPETATNLLEQIQQQQQQQKVLNKHSKDTSRDKSTLVPPSHVVSNDYVLFLQQIPTCSKNPKYIRLSSTDSLKDLLRGQTVNEYPTIYCVAPRMVSEYPTTTSKIQEVETKCLQQNTIIQN